jgi:hypothetical protein
MVTGTAMTIHWKALDFLGEMYFSEFFSTKLQYLKELTETLIKRVNDNIESGLTNAGLAYYTRPVSPGSRNVLSE